MERLRVFLVSLSLLLGISLNAQHLRFMGIPIDGPITAFQTKLSAKGFTLAPESKQLPMGVRAYYGQFLGKDSSVLVYYSTHTKEVYQVLVAISCGTTDDEAKNAFEYYKDLLKQKYEEVSLNSDMLENSTNGVLEFDMAIMQPPIEVGTKLLGYIEMHMNRDTDFPYEYYISLTYEDLENKAKRDANLLNDL